jgi:hypothetical protein
MKTKQKSIKALLMIAFIIILFSGSKSDLFSQNFCYEQYGNGCDPYWTSYSQWVVLPEFPDCSLYVNYKTRNCNNEVQICIDAIWTENEFNMSSDCHIFSNMFPMWPNTSVANWSFVRDLWEGTFNKLSYDIFVSEDALFTDLQKDSYLCSTGNWATKVTFFRDACQKYCYEIYNELAPGPLEQYPVLHVVTSPCTLEYCCKLTDKYCYDRYWDILHNKYVYIAQRVQERTGEESVDCSTFVGPSSGTPCPSGFTSSECLPTCIVE